MNKLFQDKCRKLLAILIEKSFPELKNKKIFVFTTPFRKNYSGLALRFFWPIPRMIFINKKRNKESIGYLNGLLVHEICHLALIERRGFIKSAFRGMLYWIFPKVRRAIEDEVNQLAIQKGYSREIYLLEKKFEKKRIFSGIQKYYMTSEEIKNYAKSIKKW